MYVAFQIIGFVTPFPQVLRVQFGSFLQPWSRVLEHIYQHIKCYLNILKWSQNDKERGGKSFWFKHTQLSISMTKSAFYLDIAINNEMMYDFHSCSSSFLAQSIIHLRKYLVDRRLL